MRIVLATPRWRVAVRTFWSTRNWASALALPAAKNRWWPAWGAARPTSTERRRRTVTWRTCRSVKPAWSSSAVSAKSATGASFDSSWSAFPAWVVWFGRRQGNYGDALVTRTTRYSDGSISEDSGPFFVTQTSERSNTVGYSNVFFYDAIILATEKLLLILVMTYHLI